MDGELFSALMCDVGLRGERGELIQEGLGWKVHHLRGLKRMG